MSTGLRRFRDPKVVIRAGERCEMCAEPIGDEHSHIVNIETRALQCSCRSCYLLFTSRAAAHGKQVAVPERYRHDPQFTLADAVWDSAGIPVSIAFLFVNSSQQQTVAFYPSPAGATESMLPGDAWSELLANNPAFADIASDVEALLVLRGEGGFEAFLVPIDVCYELVGHVRLHWKGFDGGQKAWTVINGFFDNLRVRSDKVHG
jgi:hypothetical protein